MCQLIKKYQNCEIIHKNKSIHQTSREFGVEKRQSELIVA